MAEPVQIKPRCPDCGEAVRVSTIEVRDLTGGGPRPGESFERKAWRCGCGWSRAYAHFEDGLVAQDQDAM